MSIPDFQTLILPVLKIAAEGEVRISDVVERLANNIKEQFANSPHLSTELMNAIIDAFAAHTSMSKQALDSEKVRSGLGDILLGPAQHYEALRERWGAAL